MIRHLAEKARYCGLFFILFAATALNGCSLRIAPEADPTASRPSQHGSVLVFGRMNYVVDGALKAPYGAFRPSWPAPFINALHLESGDPVQSHAVRNGDGSFYWEFPPGSYVITRIGVGQYTDETYVAWPRVAFRVPQNARVAYLGHLVLEGTSYAEPYVLSTGTQGVSRGIRYRMRIDDEMNIQLPFVTAWTADGAPAKSLFFHDGAMPIGDQLVSAWRASPEKLIQRIFR